MTPWPVEDTSDFWTSSSLDEAFPVGEEREGKEMKCIKKNTPATAISSPAAYKEAKKKSKGETQGESNDT